MKALRFWLRVTITLRPERSQIREMVTNSYWKYHSEGRENTFSQTLNCPTVSANAPVSS